MFHLWRVSERFDFGSSTARAFFRRLRFLVQSLPARHVLGEMISEPPDSPLARLLADRPETVGAAVWPYQCLQWSGAERLARIREHFAAINRLGPPLDFPTEEKLILLDASEYQEGVRIVLDQPRWFMREGQMTLNIFHQDYRAFSLAFSLRDGDGGLKTIIGAVQGRNSPHALQLYRDLTKHFYGMRPRDLLIELFRILCRELAIDTISAVSNACRIHRSRYFGKTKAEQILVDYDAIWAERGGLQKNHDFFDLPVKSPRRELDEIRSSKRNMYRKRYEMLAKFEVQLRRDFATLTPVRFEDS